MKNRLSMYHINNEISTVNSSESYLGNVLMINQCVIIPYANLLIMESGKDDLFNQNINSFINFCYVVFEEVEIITFDYEYSRLINPERRECYGGVHYLNNLYSEFWISYKSAKIILKEDMVFSKMPLSFSRSDNEKIIRENVMDNDLLSEIINSTIS